MAGQAVLMAANKEKDAHAWLPVGAVRHVGGRDRGAGATTPEALPKVIQHPPPTYPPLAQQTRIQGDVRKNRGIHSCSDYLLCLSRALESGGRDEKARKARVFEFQIFLPKRGKRVE
jgi:hypothetical protein